MFSVAQQGISQIEQRLPRAPVADPGALIAAKLVMERITGAQQRNVQPLRNVERVGIAMINSASRSRAKVSKSSRSPMWTCANGNCARIGACGGRDGGNDLRAHIRQQLAEAMQQIGFSGDSDPRPAQQKMGIEHGVLQLGALPGQPCRYGLTGDPRQCHHQPVGGIQAKQVREAMHGRVPVRSWARSAAGYSVAPMTRVAAASPSAAKAASGVPPVVSG